MAPKKYYAVARGRTPGIYTEWHEAKAQVDGFEGARYKGFPTRRDAEEWMKNPGEYRGPVSSAKKSSRGTAGADNPEPGRVSIYTDGGCINNPGPGGYGVVQIYGETRKELSGGFRLTTNNRMELMAAIAALRDLEYRDVPVTLFTDSSYVVNGVNKGWAKKWRKNNWMKPDKQPALNHDLWSELLDLAEPLDIAFVWVKGHAGNPLNERCDFLAVSTARKPNLPPDRGYQR